MPFPSGRAAAVLLVALLLAGCTGTGPGQPAGGDGGTSSSSTGSHSSGATGAGSGDGSFGDDGTRTGHGGDGAFGDDGSTGTGGTGTGGNGTQGGGAASGNSTNSTTGPSFGPQDPSRAPPTSGPLTAAPAIQVGSYWTRRNVGSTAEVTTRAESIEQRGGETTDLLATRIEQQAGGGTTTSTTKSWVRTSDLALVESYAAAQVDAGVQHYNFTATTTYSPPCMQYQWPLDEGATWQATCSAHMASSYGSYDTTQVTNYTVEAHEFVDVPAGTFDAFRIRAESHGSSVVQWFSAEACGVVRTVSGSGDKQVVTELTAYDC